MPSFTPLSRLDFDRLHAMPDMNINIPANQGSAGLNVSTKVTPHSTLNIKPIV